MSSDLEKDEGRGERRGEGMEDLGGREEKEKEDKEGEEEENEKQRMARRQTRRSRSIGGEE